LPPKSSSHAKGSEAARLGRSNYIPLPTNHTMPRMGRAASPAMSEADVDISKSLYQDDVFDSDAEDQVKPAQNNNGPKNKKRKTDNVVDAFEDDDDEDEAFIAATQVKANRKSENKVAKKAGAFQSMGLNSVLLKAITRKGFNVPTPIQRKTVPLIMDGQDVVGMARTGSGKTAAFVIPMIEKLKSHSAKVGARAIVLSPSRELALQTLKVVKEMGRGTDLRSTLLVGGDSLEDQFGSMASNPDIIIATPGRFEHLKVEMGLELSSVKYVVFDEADRLFEMGFAAQLTEIMHSLPTTRQTLLFSATLPKSLVEFARAGLQDPKLVRLDAESKIAPGLQSAFFTVKRAEKEASLLYILQEVIKMPTGETEATIKARSGVDNKKRKRDGPGPKQMPTTHSTVIFAATKHHVEYLAAYLKALGYATSFVYGALDQTARKMQTEEFRTGLSNILVVTDVAARGLDIPVLANVINYDFPPQPKVFIHRVGRTARAGESGWSYSLISQHDMPYLVDLQLFLGRKLLIGRAQPEEGMFKDAIVVGTLVRDKLERYMEEAAKVVDNDSDLSLMREVAGKGEKQYLRTRNSASAESVKRSKNLALSATEAAKGSNLLFEEDEKADDEQARLDMLARVSSFKPQETVFEVGKRGAAATEMSEIMQKRRNQVAAREKIKIKKAEEAAAQEADAAPAKFDRGDEEDSDDDLVLTQPGGADMEEASDGELELAFTQPETMPGGKKANKWQDSEHFMSYNPTTINVAEDRGYGVNSGGVNVNNNFVSDAAGATMDLANDDDKAFATANKVNSMRWDKKNKKYVSRANDVDGSKGSRYITGESGQKIAASFKSGRFDAWKKANKVNNMPRVGEMEKGNARNFANGDVDGKRYKHKQDKAPKAADKYRDDYDDRKKRVDAAKEARRGRFAEGKGKSEIKSVDDVRKIRRDEQKKKEKNARPQKRR
jgi:ATP-dependent RNA helicase DDX54/DBP10